MIPLGNYLIVKPDDKKDEKSQGGIYLVKSDSPVDTGTVKTLSPSLQSVIAEDGIAILPGNRVLYPSGAGTKIKDDGEDVLIMPYTKLLAIL